MVEGKPKFVGVVEKAGELYWVEVFSEFCQGLKHLKKFSHVIVMHARFHLENFKSFCGNCCFPRMHACLVQEG